MARQQTEEITDGNIRGSRKPRCGSSSVLCSNAKRFLRTSCALELRRPLLCYTKLTELLHDARFRDMCTVELQAQGYMVAPATGDRRQINLSLRFLPRLVGCHASSSARTSPCALKTRRPRLRGRLFLVLGVVYCRPRKTLNRRRTRGGPPAAGSCRGLPHSTTEEFHSGFRRPRIAVARRVCYHGAPEEQGLR